MTETKDQKKKMSLGKKILIGLGIVIFIGVVANRGKKKETTADKTTTQTEALVVTNENETPVEQVSIKENKLPANTYLIGEEISFKNYTLQVPTFEEKPYYNSEFRPEEGNKFVAVEFLMKNNGTEKIDYNALEFRLLDENSYEYKTVTFGFKKPYFSGGDIQPNRAARGWITFEVPKSSKKFEVKYTPGLFVGNKDYFIRLYKDNG